MTEAGEHMLAGWKLAGWTAKEAPDDHDPDEVVVRKPYEKPAIVSSEPAE